MKSKVALILFLFLAYSLFSGWVYVCKIKDKCPAAHTTVTKSQSAISFAYNSSETVLGTKYKTFKQDISSKLGENSVLKIVGLYSSSETNSSAFDNLGIARAVAAQSLFSEVDQSRFMLDSKQQDFDSADQSIEALEFYILIKNKFVEEANFGGILRFEEGDVAVGINPKLDAYLTFLSLEKKDKMLDIIGHSDDKGDEGENNRLGLARANRIKALLVSKGMDSNRLKSMSKGQSVPLADNGTEEGRATNRRVEIHIK
jgi:OOP family OmpA-OmpF porin